MTKNLLNLIAILIWIGMWLLISLIMYTVSYILDSTDHLTYYQCIFEKFTVISQFVMGWIPGLWYIEDHKDLLV